MEFSELALIKLSQIMPELTSYIVSFADITDQSIDQEASPLQIGVFLVRLGFSYYYIPIVSKGDLIQPIDSLFSMESQSFIPLTKKIVNNLIDTSKRSLGKSTRIPNTVVQNPSVYHLVTPPRTGKFVYASASRISDFLGILPSMTKQAVLEKFSEDKEVYSALHKLFGLENIFASLRPTLEPTKSIEQAPVEVITGGKGLPQEDISSILDKGYTVKGKTETLNRVAIVSQNFDDMGALTQLTSSDGGKEYTVFDAMGKSCYGYIPKRVKNNSSSFPVLLKKRDSWGGDHVFCLFRNCDYSLSNTLIGKPIGSSENEILRGIIGDDLHTTASKLSPGMKFAVFSPDFELVGVYVAYKLNHAGYGTTILGSSLQNTNNSIVQISAFRNVTSISVSYTGEVFMPYNTVIIPLNRDLSHDFETNINSVARRLDFITKQTLGNSAELGYDGVEFNYNGSHVGDHINVIKILVLKEGINPTTAESFIKKAKESGRVKFYMSKAADFEPAEIPQYGQQASPQYNPLDIQGPDFMGAVQSAVKTQDSETVESTIISELLQTRDMAEHILEYLPEIKSAIDKLGRTLFLIRLNLGKLGGQYEASELLSFVSNLRNVYRLLGENYLKLEQMSQPEVGRAEREA